MAWATHYIEQLRLGQNVKFRPRGASMIPLIHSGDLVEVAPITVEPKKGDIVLCKVNGKQFLHLITAVKGNQYQISNNKGHVNGWCGLHNIFGVVISVSP